MDRPVEFTDLLRLLYKKRRLIIGFTAMVALVAVIITLLKPDYYKSTTTFYPASDDLSSPDMIFGLTNDAMQYYGTDSDADRILSIGASSDFHEKIIRHFNLYDHYDIDTTSRFYRLKTLKEFRKNYDISRNKFDAIELSVEDTDPIKAAAMANYARALLNDMTSDMIKSGLQAVMNNLSIEISTQEKLMQTISDSLQKVKTHYGIIDPEVQGEKLASKYDKIRTDIRADEEKLNYLNELSGSYRWKRDSIAKIDLRLKTNEALLRMLDSTGDSRFNLAKFSEGSNAVISLQTYFSDIKNKLVQNKIRFQNTRSVKESSSQALILVEKGAIPDKKSRPKRSIIVAGATIAGFVFAILGVLLLAAYDKVDWKKISA